MEFICGHRLFIPELRTHRNTERAREREKEKEKKKERECSRKKERDRETEKDQLEGDRCTKRGSPTKEVLETAESLTRERNISKMAEIHWQNTGNRLHCIFCISILPVPLS